MHSLLKVNSSFFESTKFASWSADELYKSGIARQTSQLPLVAKEFMDKQTPPIMTITDSLRSSWIRALEERNREVKLEYGSFFSKSLVGEPITFKEPVKRVEGETLANGDFYDPNAVFIMSGEPKTVMMSPVPTMPGQKTRVGIEFIVPLLAPFFGVSAGKVVVKMSDAWRTALERTPYIASGFVAICPLLDEFLQPALVDMGERLRTGLSGLRWIQFLRDTLVSLDMEKYLTVHKAVQLHILKSEPRYSYLTKRIPVTGNKVLDDAVKAIAAGGVGDAVLLAAPCAPEHVPIISTSGAVPGQNEDQNYQRSKVVVSAATSLVGESSATLRAFTLTRGYAAMMGKNECDIVFLVSLTLAALAQFKKVQVSLNSTALIEPVYSSYQTWLATYTTEEQKEFSLRFILPPNCLLSLNSVYVPMSGVSPLDSYVTVWDAQTAIANGSNVADVVKTSETTLAHLMTHKRFIVRLGIYGTMATFKSGDVQLYGYGYGDASNYQGILSTEPGLKMMEKVKNAYKLKDCLIKMNNSKMWYDYVERCNDFVITAPFRPSVFCSPICNVVTVNKTRFRINRSFSDDITYSTVSALSDIAGGNWGETPSVIPGEVSVFVFDKNNSSNSSMNQGKSETEVDGDQVVYNKVADPPIATFETNQFADMN
jgi:hypothetical protein